METHQIVELLSQTLNPDSDAVRAATDALDRLSTTVPNFAFYLLSIATAATGSENQGHKIAAATYLKNLTRQNIDTNNPNFNVSKEFRNALVHALLHVEPSVLKVLIEAFRFVVAAEFVKENLWPELVPELRSVIQNSDLIIQSGNCEWKTINALTVLHSLIRPFQYFLNPKVAREPVPQQLELIAREILVPLLDVFHQHVKKALNAQDGVDVETENILLKVCKCIYFSVRSHMPSTLVPLLPALCRDLFGILGSLRLNAGVAMDEGRLLRLKTGKRSLLVFCALITRHRKFSDKQMPAIVDCVLELLRQGTNVSKVDFLSERVLSLAFDVISRVLETGPGWKLVSPHFSSLIDSAIFPALIMNEQDITEWEEDADEYIRKNLPSELEEFSGWREDLFTARKSALNLLGVIAISKGPPVVASNSSKRKKGEKSKHKDRSSMGELLVLPFLSKFPIPTDANVSSDIVNNYYGVLLAYGSLTDFLSERTPAYAATLIRSRVLPVYRVFIPQPYLVASANWVLGELASCIPEELSAEIYSLLLKALTMPDVGEVSYYPVRMSAAGAITQLVENDYLPPEWLPLLQEVVSGISGNDEEASILFELLGTLVGSGNEKVAPYIPQIVLSLVGDISTCIPPPPEPWPQVVERGFAALAVMTKCWEQSVPEEAEQSELGEIWASGQSIIAKAFSDLLQQAWLRPEQQSEGDVALSPWPSSSVDDSSTLLRFILQVTTEKNMVVELKVSELLQVWADLIADWHAWEETEDMSIFSCIREVFNLHKRFSLKNFMEGEVPSPPAPPISRRSIIEGIGSFVSEAFSQYPSAVWRATSCVHSILHFPNHTFSGEGVKQSLVTVFSQAAFLRFKEVRSKPCSLWKPLLLSLSSCYLCYPDIVERILEEYEDKGLIVWVSSLNFFATRKFEHDPSSEAEIKLTILTLAKVVERQMGQGAYGGGLSCDCFASLLEACIRLKDVEEEDEDEDIEEDDASDEETEDEDDEDSEDDEREETEEEFLERCAQAALTLESGTLLEEGDLEDQELEIELGVLEEVNEQAVVKSLIARYHGILIEGQSISPQLISSFVEAFPDCRLYFQLPEQ